MSGCTQSEAVAPQAGLAHPTSARAHTPSNPRGAVSAPPLALGAHTAPLVGGLSAGLAHKLARGVSAPVTEPSLKNGLR